MNRPEAQVVVCFPFTGGLVGGSHISALVLIRNLDRSRFAPLIVLHEPSGPLGDLLHNEGIPFETAPVASRLERGVSRNNLRALTHLALSIPPIVKFLRSRRVAIVHTNDGRMHIIWGVASRLAGAKLLWHHRGDSTAFGLTRVAPLIANRMVAVSRFASPRPAIFSAARKCSVIHSPFDISIGTQFDRQACRSRLIDELGCPSDTRLVGYVGTLVDRKRPLVFVETIAALHREAPEMKFAGLLFGGALRGFDEAVKALAVKLGISDRVHVMGFRYPGEPWLAALDALLVTAVDEPFGRTLIEAMLLGTPVVATASGGNLEAIRDGETGILVQPDNPAAFCSATLALFRNPASMAAIADTARMEARKQFGIDPHVNSIVQVYDELLGPWKGQSTSSQT